MPCKISEKISNIKMAVEPINIGAMGLCLTICKGNSSNARLLGGVVYSDKKEYTPSFYSTILQPTGCCRVMKYLIAYSLGIFQSSESHVSHKTQYYIILCSKKKQKKKTCAHINIPTRTYGINIYLSRTEENIALQQTVNVSTSLILLHFNDSRDCVLRRVPKSLVKILEELDIP